MTFKDLKRIISSSSSTLQEKSTMEETENPRLALLLSKMKNIPFWIWDKDEHRKAYVAKRTECCANHILGLPKKGNIPMPLFPYEKLIYDALITDNHKCLWIKKATALGVSEFFLRLMSWLCLKDSK